MGHYSAFGPSMHDLASRGRLFFHSSRPTRVDIDSEAIPQRKLQSPQRDGPSPAFPEVTPAVFKRQPVNAAPRTAQPVRTRRRNHRNPSSRPPLFNSLVLMFSRCSLRGARTAMGASPLSPCSSPAQTRNNFHWRRCFHVDGVCCEGGLDLGLEGDGRAWMMRSR